MNEIYWLQRVGALSNLFCVILVVSIIVFCVSIFVYFISAEDGDLDNVAKRVIKFVKISFVTLVIGALGGTFTPTTKEMYAIYGIGGAIDYIKSNDKAKQLPDKCVDALTRYVDSIEKENKDNNNN